MLVYKLVNTKGAFIGAGYDEAGFKQYIKDHVMILADHAKYQVRIGNQISKDKTEYLLSQTPEEFIKS
jgi:hypothetical protein